ncbi:MAG: hypothetical protein N4A38_04520 [Candidatus Gracilibacteria bacterium]|nr:hypothetical protein [Candidatus Gracilibacteria bacterium]
MEKLFNKKTIEGIFEALGKDVYDEINIALVNNMYENQGRFIKYLNDSFETGINIFDFREK